MLLISATAALLTAALTAYVLAATRRLSLFDSPAESRRVHTRPTPRLGGIAVFAGCVITLTFGLLAGLVALQPGEGRLLAGLVCGGTIMFATGLYDDLRGMRASRKLLAQVFAALLVYAIGNRVGMLSLGSLEISLGWFALPVTVLWIVGVTNAFNLIDGLDGLATGVGIVALLTLLAVAAILGHATVVLVTAVMAGSLMGFIRYNFSPARIFLGDCGSLFVGFTLAVLSIHASIKSATVLIVVVPLFALAVPLLDVAVAVARRWLRGVPVFDPDARHIHHRLLDLGLDHGRAALVLSAVAALLAALGVSLAFAPPVAVARIALIGGIGSLVLVIYGARRLGYHEFGEAGSAVATGVLRLRRVIRDQIHVRDLTARVEHAGSVEQMRQVIEGHAAVFGFVGMHLCNPGDPSPPEVQQAVQPVWSLDFPVSSAFGEPPLLLRIWCAVDDGNRPYGAERVARLLGHAVSCRLVEVLNGAAAQRDVVPLHPPQAVPAPPVGTRWRRGSI